ncbi:MAG: hypothetical protein M1825_003170 [Sarcosagium campestre]|nr:MAG: hypothetical protein M1825_003170 [Sarcosagium campestre]
MDHSPLSIKERFREAEEKRTALENFPETSSATYQDSLKATLAAYNDCRKLAIDLALFSRNESVEDIATADLPYLLIDFHLAELTLRNNISDRKSVLHVARGHHEAYLNRLDSYDVLSSGEKKMHEKYLDLPDSFSTSSTTDAAARRESKIARFKDERVLKQKLEYLRQNPRVLQDDDSSQRDLYLTDIKLCTHQSFATLESIAQELEILGMAPPGQPPGSGPPERDIRERNGDRSNTYSDRLDPPISQLLSNGNAGPILSKDGRPLKPFTLLDSRDRLRQGVFKSGHNLPTMTIDEYLEEEKRRGGIIEGGGEQSGLKPEPDEDNLLKADEETMKAREWDEFTEANPKYVNFGSSMVKQRTLTCHRGSGNTMNRG